MNRLTDQDYEKFNQFIFSIDDSIEEVIALGDANDIKIDFSESLPKRLEELIEKIDLQRSNNRMINVFGQFLGEYFRKTMGGQWSLGDDPGSSISFGQPVISGFNSIGHVFNPIRIVRNFVGRRISGIFESAIEAQRGEDTLSHLKPEE
jgi:hypothetical protein